MTDAVLCAMQDHPQDPVRVKKVSAMASLAHMIFRRCQHERGDATLKTVSTHYCYCGSSLVAPQSSAVLTSCTTSQPLPCRKEMRASMGSRADNGVVRCMQTDRGARIRTFRKLQDAQGAQPAAGSAAVDGCRDPPAGDTNGKQYTEALDRLTSFKVRHKKRVWQDRRKADWQEEDAHLRRASQELTKAIQNMLRAPVSKSRGTIAPAWGVGEDEEQDINRAEKSHINPEHPGSPKALIEFEAQELDLERARCADMQADGSHIQQLRTLVADFARSRRTSRTTSPRSVPAEQDAKSNNFPERKVAKAVPKTIPTGNTLLASPKNNVPVGKADESTNCHQSSSTIDQVSATTAAVEGSRTGFVAELLVQTRTVHRKAGLHLAERSVILEADVEASRQTLAGVLTPDCYERRSSTRDWVLGGIGFRMGDEKVLGGDETRQATTTTATSGNLEATGTAFVGGVWETVVREEICHRLRTLEEEHASRLSVLRESFLCEAGGATSAGSIEAALDKTGGWTVDAHFRFMKVMKAAKSARSGGAGVGGFGVTDGISGGGVDGGRLAGSTVLTKRLIAEFPDLTKREISRHASWYRLRCLHTTKKRIEGEGHKRKLEELIVWGKETLQALRQKEIETAARARELKEHERQRAERDELLREQRQLRERREREDREREDRASRERSCREEEALERKAAEDKRKRNAVAEYHASLQELRVCEAKAREAEARAAEAERIQRMPNNRERVGFRKDRARQKQEERERREREVEALETKRMQVLEKLAASVPYAQACANAEAKLDHVTAATAAHFDQFHPFDRSRGHCPMFGYNTGKVFQDARFRLGLYLREAGVSGSKAAHAAVMRAAGPRLDAPF